MTQPGARDRPSETEVIVWEQVARRAHDDSRLTRPFAVLMFLAGILAAVGILTDNAILIVGAMIVSPDFGPTAGLAVGLITRRYDRAFESVRALAVGFGLAAMAGLMIGVLASGLDRVPAGYPSSSSVADLVTTINGIALLVAFVAGVAGAVSLGTAKSGAVVGVAVSITTIPAAANIGVAFALGDPYDGLASTVMLLINLGGLVSAELVTFWVVRRVARRPESPPTT